ncbi:CsgG/HfaB family protein [Larkinella soli]|uniref:CsgG/HfaB family protein n=1 Tax=Larkinella soli TaxID=1770527 RepID=UPI000FFB2A48|nr:CsgG/HfaB family protein [Larkinella soli]
MKTLPNKTSVAPLLYALLVGLLSGCSAGFHQPTKTRNARPGEETAATADLRRLPAPKEKIVAAVYKFRDQTGQYKPTESGAGWSTAVSQGTTSILLKALEESGWFVPIERENVGDLMNERKIVRMSMAQARQETDNLPPLLFAGIILEGGIVSYDANTITGGAGLRFFGTGGSSQYRQDRVTVYLRAVATKTGRILKTVYTSKTILSQSVDAGTFRYVSFKRLLEAETGFATNEPSQLAVTEAIEKAVHSLVLEGIRDHLWTVSEPAAEQADAALAAYEREKAAMSETDLYGGRNTSETSRLTLQPYVSALRYKGDYAAPGFRTGYGLAVDVYLSRHFGLQLNAGTGTLGAGRAFSQSVTSVQGSLLYRSLPFRKMTPLVSVGAGMIAARSGSAPGPEGRKYPLLTGGFGVEYALGPAVGLRTMLEYQQPMTDELDATTAGRYYDYYLRGSAGLCIYLGRPLRR